MEELLWYVAVFFMYGVIFGGITSAIAEDRGRDRSIWFLIGIFAPIFGLIAALLIRPPGWKKEEVDYIPYMPMTDEVKSPDQIDHSENRIRFCCQQCGRSISASPARAGKYGECPACKGPVRVPKNTP